MMARIGHGALLALDGCEIRHKAPDIAVPSLCRFTRSRPARPLLGTMTRPRAFAAFFALAALLTGGAQPSKPLRAAWHPCRKLHGPNHVRCHLPPIPTACAQQRPYVGTTPALSTTLSVISPGRRLSSSLATW